MPTGWTGVNNIVTNDIDRTTYWLVDAGAPGDFIITSDFDLTTFSSITVNVNVATFGSGTGNPLKIEYSRDSGATWSPTVFTTATPTSSSPYIAGGPITISAAFSSTTKLRFSANGTSGRGVRIQQLGITGIVSGSDSTPPSIEARTPGLAATGVSINPSFSITFDEAIAAGAGFVRLFRENGASDIAVPISAVAINGNTASFTASGPLENGALHYVLVDDDAFFDLATPTRNAFPGILSDTAWTFTTEAIPVLTDSSPYTQGFTGFSFANPSLPDGWALSGPVTGFNADETQRVWNEGFNSGLRGGADLLGFQHTSSTGTLVKTLTLRNGTGAPITDLTISYSGRAARLTELRSPSYTVRLNGTTVAGLAYSTASGDSVLGASVSALSIPAGGLITITWSSDRDTVSTSGASKQIGLDDVSVSVGSTAFAPSVGVTSVTYPTLGTTTASVSSEVAGDGGSAITARGFVYSPTAINPSPIIGGLSVSQETVLPAEVGTMSRTLTVLAPSTSYTVRSYASNAQGTTYSAPATFITLGAPPLFTTEYTQGFVGFTGNIVTGGFPDGWKLLSSTGANNYVGTWGPSSSSGGIVGGDSNPGVLGYQHTGSTGIATASLTLVNNTGATLTQLNVAYLGRVERPTEGRSPVWTVTVAGTTVPELSYTTANGVDEMKSHFVTGLSIADGSEFTITWASDANVGTGGSRRQIGIADVEVSLNAPIGGFAGWIDDFFPGNMDAETIAFGADPDFDGIPNGIEALIGGNPDSPGVFATTELTKNGNTFTFLYPQAREVPLGVTASYEWSTDLLNWYTTGQSDGVNTITLAGNVYTDDGESPLIDYQVTATVTAGTATKLFVRVLAEN